MDTRRVKVLYLFIILLSVQAEREEPDADSEDSDEDWDTVQMLSDLFGSSRDLQQSRAEPPDSGPSRGDFESSINRGLRECRKRRQLPRCSWRRGYTVTGTTRTYRQQVSDDICCCACSEVNECDAIHYEGRDGGCVFHQGPTQKDRRQSGTKRWVKE